MPRRLTLFLSLLLAGACAALPEPSPSEACATPRFAIDAEFERGAFARCFVEGARRVRLEIRPEQGASNPSPWYAFRIRPKSAGKAVVVLDYGEDRHRYHPKTSTGDQWTRLDEKAVRVSDDEGKARLSLRLAAEEMFVAAQPLDTIGAALARIDAPLRAAGFTQKDVGLSADGRPVPAYWSTPPGARRLIILIARQHPPETTGAVAFDAFLSRLLEEDEEARSLRERFAIFVAPMMNPDGVARGHWRGNRSGADINRDWGPFLTPEAAPVGAAIEKLALAYAPAFLADFHSTRRNVIYAAPEQAGRSPLPDAFLALFSQRLGAQAPEITRSHNPDGTTAKAWSLETLGVAGFTYEVADEAAIDEVRAMARQAAQALIDAAIEENDP